MRKTYCLILSCAALLVSCSKKELPVKPQESNPKTNPLASIKINNAVSTGILPAGIYRLISAPSALTPAPKSMGVINASALQSAFIEQRDYTENKGQEWLINSLGNGQYTIINVHSAKALDVPFGVPNENVPLWQYTAQSPAGNAQKWKIQYQGHQVYRIKSVLDTTKGVHVKDRSAVDGGRMILKTFNSAGGDYSGYFALVPVEFTKTNAMFIGLPDTQSYANIWPDMLTAQKNWLLDNKADITIAIQHGDLTDNNIDRHWGNVKSAFRALDNQVPYALTTGNHDMSTNGTTVDRNTTKFNENFPYAEMSKLPYFGGVFNDPNGANKMDNSYYLFETGKYKWVVLNLEFGPRDIVLEWAKTICDQFADRTVIVNTHAYMFNNDKRYQPGYFWNPHKYGIEKLGPNEVNDGEEMWTKLVSIKPNIRFVVSGHVLGDGCGSLVSYNNAGKRVYQILSNFQGGVSPAIPNGGNAFLRKYKLDFVNKKLVVETYSPYLNEVFPDITGRDHNFELSDLDIVGM